MSAEAMRAATMRTSFEPWLRTECFQAPTPEAYELAKAAWQAATLAERERAAARVEANAWACGGVVRDALLSQAAAIRSGN